MQTYIGGTWNLSYCPCINARKKLEFRMKYSNPLYNMYTCIYMYVCFLFFVIIVFSWDEKKIDGKGWSVAVCLIHVGLKLSLHLLILKRETRSQEIIYSDWLWVRIFKLLSYISALCSGIRTWWWMKNVFIFCVLCTYLYCIEYKANRNHNNGSYSDKAKPHSVLESIALLFLSLVSQ